MKDEVSHQTYSTFKVCEMGLWLQCCWFKPSWQSLLSRRQESSGLKKLDYSVHQGDAVQLFDIFMTSLKKPILNTYVFCSGSKILCNLQSHGSFGRLSQNLTKRLDPVTQIMFTCTHISQWLALKCKHTFTCAESVQTLQTNTIWTDMACIKGEESSRINKGLVKRLCTER